MTEIKFSEIAEQARALDQAKQNLRKLISTKEAQQTIAKEFQKILAECPDVGVFWTQGAPSFNDGDPCYFRVHDMWICPVDTDGGEDDSVDCSTGKCPDYDEDDFDRIYCTPEQCDALYEIWSIINDEFIMESVFGSSASVKITEDSITIDDYYD